MGTAVSIDVRDPIDRAAIDDVVGWLHHVDRTFSTYLMDSPISRIGHGELSIDDADDEVRGVLAQCEAFREFTDGVFDITAAHAPNGTRFDPSGLVKGWSIELAAERLVAWGAANLSINAGGDVALRGAAGPGIGWRVGIRHPAIADRVAAVVGGFGPLAIATSATYERGAHIIDPHDGQPAIELASVTIVGPDLTLADAYATTVFVLGLDGLLWLDDHCPGYGGLAITHDDTTYSTAVFERFRLS